MKIEANINNKQTIKGKINFKNDITCEVSSRKNLKGDVNNKILYPELEDLEVIPSKEEQNFKSTMYGYDDIKIKPIPDEYVIPSDTLEIYENGYFDVREYESVDVGVFPSLQTKTVTPSKYDKNIEADYDYDGLSKVTVKKIPDEYIIPTGTLEITENALWDVSNYQYAEVNVPTSGGGGSTVTKGVIINSWDSSGYATDIEVVGMTTLPNHYLRQAGNNMQNFFGKIATLKIPDNITSIGTYCFHYLTSLTSLNLPDTITTIGTYAFNYCQKLNLTKLPSKLTTINANTFNYCSSLTLEELPDNVTSIGNYAFQSCTALKLKKLPSKLTSIGTYAFKECKNIVITEIPVGVKSIPSQTFWNCSKIEKIDLLSPNFSSIGAQAFYGNSKLAQLVVRATTPPTVGTISTAFAGSLLSKGEGYVYVPDESISDYQNATNWSTIASQIKGISELPTE